MADGRRGRGVQIQISPPRSTAWTVTSAVRCAVAGWWGGRSRSRRPVTESGGHRDGLVAQRPDGRGVRAVAPAAAGVKRRRLCARNGEREPAASAVNVFDGRCASALFEFADDQLDAGVGAGGRPSRVSDP